MKVKVILFGQLTDITGKPELVLENIRDTDELVGHLQQAYPQFREALYVIAVDKDIITTNTALENNMTIAMLPPYAGG